MKLIINTLIFYFLMCYGLQSQTNIGANIDSDLSVLSLRTYAIGTFDTRDVSYKGSPLLWDSWMYGTILLDGNKKYSPKEYQLNYNVLANLLYIRIGSQVFDMLLAKVVSLKLMTGLNEFTEYKAIDGEPSGLGLYEVLYADENLELVKRTNIKMQKSFYNAALDVGDVKPKLKRSEALYIFKADKLFELPRNKKKLVSIHKETKDIKEIVTFFKENRVNLKDTEEIRSALIEFNKNK